MKTYKLKSLEELKGFAREIFKYQVKVFLLEGDLGAGKTTFVGTFIKENILKADESFEHIGVMSPTFSLINNYQTKNAVIVHADMYRLNKNDFEKEELFEAIDNADYSFIEWPSKLEGLKSFLDSYSVVSLDFKINSDQTRTVSVKQL